MGSLSNEVEIKKVAPNISFHSFNTTVAEKIVRFELLKFKDSLYIWIGDGRCRSFSDLSFSLLSKYSKEPASTKIMGDTTNLTSVNLANKLTKKLKKPIYVSYNLPDDRLTVTVINERLSHELIKNKLYFEE